MSNSKTTGPIELLAAKQEPIGITMREPLPAKVVRAPKKTDPAAKIASGLMEALRVKRLINAVWDVDGHELTEQEAVTILAKVDAPLIQS